jgi:malonyl-CoA O-methyltransferase
MNVQHRQRIRGAFSLAREYDRHARVQRRVADELAGRIAALDLPPEPRVLEIGCGTGFLTEALAGRGIGGQWLVTDLSPAMVERCRARLGTRAGTSFAVLDGEYGAPDAGTRFDLICSSLTLQWFDDLPSAIARMLGWLAPGGRLAFTTLAAGTFAEWRAAHLAEGLAPGTPEFPSVEALRAILPGAQIAAHRVERHIEENGSAREFLSALKGIGAGTAARGYRPLSAGALKRVMHNFEQAGSRATYEVVTCTYGAPA